MRTLTDAYRGLIEGALVDLGTIVMIAARIVRSDADQSYSLDVVDGVKAGDVVGELVRQGPPISGGIDMLWRNSSAHASITVTDTGITATERRITQGRVSDQDTRTVSDAEFMEQLISLQEVLMALATTVMPWLWTHPNPRIGASLASIAMTDRHNEQALALLGGYAGLRDLSVTTSEDQMVISATRRHADAEANQNGTLGLVPAAFGGNPTATTVELRIAGLRPVVFARDEFAATLDQDYSLTAIDGLCFTYAKWLLHSGLRWTPDDEALYITLPLTRQYETMVTLGVAPPPSASKIGESVAGLRAVLTTLDTVIEPGRRSELTRSVVEQFDITIACFLIRLEVLAGRRPSDAATAAGQQMADSIAVVAMSRDRVLAPSPHPSADVDQQPSG